MKFMKRLLAGAMAVSMLSNYSSVLKVTAEGEESTEPQTEEVTEAPAEEVSEPAVYEEAPALVYEEEPAPEAEPEQEQTYEETPAPEETVTEETAEETPAEPEETVEETEAAPETKTMTFEVVDGYGFVVKTDATVTDADKRETKLEQTITDAGEFVTVWAVPADGFEVDYWELDGERLEETDKVKVEAYEIALDQDHHYTVHFRKQAAVEEEEKRLDEASAPVEEETEEAFTPVTYTATSGNNVIVTVVDTDGAFPKGTTMKVTEVPAEQVFDAVNNAVEGEVQKVKAVDITFYDADGNPIEPEKPVQVSMKTFGMNNASENQSVVHIDNDNNASVVADANTALGLTTAEFETDAFSVYVVVETDVTGDEDQNAVATYEFYVDGELKTTEYIKSGDTLVDPGDLAGDGANVVFKGWKVAEGQDIQGETPGEMLEFGVKTSVPKTETIKINASVTKTYYVTFLGEKLDGERGIVAVKTVEVEDDETGSVTVSDVNVTPKSDKSAFTGWSLADDGEPIEGDSVEVTGRMNLYAVVVDANWIHFYENVPEGSDSDATYTGPVYVAKTDDVAGKKPADPTRKGYTFGGWYKEKECTNAFEWTGKGLEDDIDLYAKWVPGEAKYTVVIWKQKVTDDKDAEADARTYDFETSFDINSTTGFDLSKVDFSEYQEYSFTGFHYGRTELPDPAVVKATGESVVNVYYDRNKMTINFYNSASGSMEYVATEDEDGAQYGVVDGNYVPLVKDGNTWATTSTETYTGNDYYQDSYDNDGTQYGIVDGNLVELEKRQEGSGLGRRTYYYYNGERYTGNRYKQGEPYYGTAYALIDGKLVALDYDYWSRNYTYQKTTPYTGTRYKLVSKPDRQFTGLYGQTLAQNGQTWPTESGYGWYQNPDGRGTRLTFLDAFKFDGLSGVSENNTVLTQYRNTFSGGNQIKFYKEELDGSWKIANTVYSSNNSTFTVTEKYEGFSAYQYRNNSQTSWDDVSAGDSKSAGGLELRFKRNIYTLSFMQDGELLSDLTKEVPFEETLSGFKPQDPVKEHYDFAGWFEDVALQQAVDWESAMPSANKVLYAKFTPKVYHVSLDPNGGEFQNAQVGEFNVPLDTILDKTSLIQNITKDKHELVGWFDKNTGAAYGFGKIEEDVNLIAKWRYPGQVSIIYDAAGHAGKAPADSYKYATDSSVVLAAPPEDIETGYEFVGWKVNNTVYYTNNTFDITEDIIEDYNPETKIGKITVTAVYNDKNAGPFEKTYIRWFKNDGSDCFHTDILENPTGDVKDSTLLVNQMVDIQAAPTREGYVFLGWAKVADTGSNIDKEKALTADQLLIKYENGSYKTTDNKPATKVAADNDRIYEAMFAVWDKVYTVVYTDGVSDEEIFADQTTEGLVSTDTTPVFDGDEPTRTGYTFNGWNPEYTEALAVDRADDKNTITYVAQWNAADVNYTVKHLQQNLENDEYTEVEADRETKTGKTGAMTEATAKSYEGFTAQAVTQQTIAGDGTTVVEIRYDRQKYTVKYQPGDHGTFAEQTTENVKYGAATPAAPETTGEAGYTFTGWTPTVAETVTADATYVAQWTANSDTKYTVEYYYQKNGTYPAEATDSDERTGTTDTTVEVTDEDKAPTQDGYILDENAADTKYSGTIAGDGSLVLKVFFKQQFTVKYQPGDHGTFAEQTTGSLDYGVSTPAAPATTGEAGYTFTGWTPTVAETVTADATYVAQWEANANTKYKVEHYQQNLDNDEFTLKDTEELTGTTDTTATATPKTYEGFTFDATVEGTVQSGTIAGDGSLVLKLYYTRNSHKVTYEYTGTVPSEAPAVPAEATYKFGASVPKATVPTLAGYTFVGWNGEVTTMPDKDVKVTGSWTANANTKYKVEHYQQNLDNDEFTLKDTEELTGTTDTTATANPKAYEGFTFDETVEGTVKSGTIAGDGSLVLKLYYTRNTYKVTYSYTGTVPAGASELPVEATYKYGASVTVADDATAPGYTFSGWSKEDFTMPAEDVEITGSFTAKGDTPYKVEHYQQNVDGEGFTLKDTENLTGKTDTTATATPKTYEGFTFDATVEGTVQSGTIAGDGSLVLKLYYTRNTYKVTYSYTGTVPAGASELPVEATYKYGATVTVADDATAPGYTFSGWSKEDFTMPAEDVEITGSFTANTNTAYKVEHYQQNLDNDEFTLKDTENLTGTTDTTATATPMTYEGFTFDATVEGTVQSGTIAGDGSLVLKLYYTRNSHKVTYEYTGTVPSEAPAVPAEATYKYEAEVSVEAEPEDIVDYVFAGWTTGDADVDDNKKFTMPDKDVKFTGEWKDDKNNNDIPDDEDRFKVVYDLDGGTTTSEKTEFSDLKVGDKTPTIADPTKTDYVFTGWSPKVADTVKAEDAKDSKDKLTITYKATYKEDKNNNDIPDDEDRFKVVYDLDGGTTTSKETEFNDLKVGDKTPTIEEPVKENYEFTGWKPEVAETVKAEDAKDSTDKLTITYTATWKELPIFKITYKLNGGSFDGKTDDIVETYHQGTVISIHEAPVREGYTFTYWKGSEYQPGDKYTVTEDHVFEAQWEAEKKKVTPTPEDKVPNTGDHNATAFWMFIMMTALAGAAGTLHYRRKYSD